MSQSEPPFRQVRIEFTLTVPCGPDGYPAMLIADRLNDQASDIATRFDSSVESVRVFDQFGDIS